jgi:uncharacterized membrane protein YqjE
MTANAMLKDSLIKFFKLNDIASNLTGYIETRMELLKIEIREDIAKGMSRVIVFILMAFVFTLFVFFVSMAAAYKLGEFAGQFGGFAIIAGIYLLVALVLFLARERLTRVIEKQIQDITKKRK